MRFDFEKNTFVDTNAFNPRPFIVGTDRVLSEQDAFQLHRTLIETLKRLDISAGHPVIIFGEKEALFPVAMISLITLNIPYIPIDAIMPEGRVRKIKSLSGSKVLINCSAFECPTEFEIQIESALRVTQNERVEQFPIIPGYSSDDPLRYILFTSGSTGEPKGVQISASAFLSFVTWFKSWDGINNKTVFMNQAPFSFDISLCDFIGGFANGSRIILNNYSILKNGNLFLNRLLEYDGNTLVCTPSFINMYLTIPDFCGISYPELKQIIFIGEELFPATVRKLRRAFPNLKIINAYGPTEATVVTTYIEITDDVLQEFPAVLPIGYSRPGGEILILNESKNASEIGEIAIVGDHVSIGYLNNEKKNTYSFFTHNGKRAYKTGDFGFIKNNIVFFSGRKDEQIKLNGYRIELEEISNQLLKHPDIINATVLPLKSGNTVKKIVSFIILKNGVDASAYKTILKDYLSSVLPGYMIPSDFIPLREFPLNSNYKVDKEALLKNYLES